MPSIDLQAHTSCPQRLSTTPTPFPPPSKIHFPQGNITRLPSGIILNAHIFKHCDRNAHSEKPFWDNFSGNCIINHLINPPTPPHHQAESSPLVHSLAWSSCMEDENVSVELFSIIFHGPQSMSRLGNLTAILELALLPELCVSWQNIIGRQVVKFWHSQGWTHLQTVGQQV